MNLLRGAGVGRITFNDGTVTGTNNRNLVFMTLKEINLGITAEDVRQTGGDRLFPLDIYTHTKSGRIRIVDASLNLEVLELMGCGKATSSENFLVYEFLDVISGSVTVNADVVAGTMSVELADGTPITGFTVNNRVVSGLENYNGQKLTFRYETNTVSDAIVYSFRVQDEPLYFEIIHSSRFRDPSTNQIKIFQTRIYRCRLIGNIEFSYRHGEFTAPTIEAEVLDPGRSDRKIITYAIGTQPSNLVQV